MHFLREGKGKGMLKKEKALKRKSLKKLVDIKIEETFKRLGHNKPPNLLIDYGYSTRKTGEFKIRTGTLWFNLEVLECLPDDFINTTVPHEVCHVVACTMSPLCIWSPHNDIWQGLMIHLGLEPFPKAEYTRNWRQPSNNFPYTCNCEPQKIYHFKQWQHNLLKKGRRSFTCKICKEKVKSL